MQELAFPTHARAPEFGVRVALKGDRIQLEASDSGGSGYAHAAMLVPVERYGDQLKLPAKLREALSRSSDRLFELTGVQYIHFNRGGSPYVFDLKLKSWPQAEYVLLLLLYIQADGIGGWTRPPNRAERQRVESGRHRPELAAQAILEALEHDTIEELRGGLISGTVPTNEASDSESRSIFALASCQYPSDFLDRMPNGESALRGPADASLLALADRLGNRDAPSLLLLAGDQVYIDATAGLFDPKVEDDRYRVPYERRGQSRGAKATMQRCDLAVEMILDDHEIGNNWAINPNRNPTSGSAIRADPAFTVGRRAYVKYQYFGPSAAPRKLWRDDFRWRGFPFFLGDTRTGRVGRNALNINRATIMSRNQFKALRRWLDNEPAKLSKFVLTPSAVLPRRRMVADDPACAIHSDSWDGYPLSLHSLLGYLCDNEIQKVIFLSGDEHLSSFVEAVVLNMVTGKKTSFWSIHSSPLYAPYPFANAKPTDFAGSETFRFPDARAGPYECVVKTVFCSGDGFALVEIDPMNNLSVDFIGADGVKRRDTIKRNP